MKGKKDIFHYGSAEIFGKKVPLTKADGLNRVYLNTSEKAIYDEYIRKMKEENKEQNKRDLENFFKSQKKK